MSEIQIFGMIQFGKGQNQVFESITIACMKESVWSTDPPKREIVDIECILEFFILKPLINVIEPQGQRMLLLSNGLFYKPETSSVCSEILEEFFLRVRFWK